MLNFYPLPNQKSKILEVLGEPHAKDEFASIVDMFLPSRNPIRLSRTQQYQIHPLVTRETANFSNG